MIDNADITVVVQGPVQSLPDRDQDEGITHQCLHSVRTYLPGARIVLSTWENQDLAGLDYDELVINKDPGPNIIGYRKNGEPRRENYNRQIVSSLGGLKRVTTRYALKLRSDNFLISNRFKSLQTAFPKRGTAHRYSRERVVTNNTFTRQYAKGMRVVFHSCDFFYFGLTEDVLDMWDLDHFEDFRFDPSRDGKMQHRGAPYYATDATQDLWLRYLNKHMAQAVNLRHLHDISRELLQTSDQCYANNLVIGAPEDIGLALPSKFGSGTRAVKTSSLMAYLSHLEWQQLYQRHCDPDFHVTWTMADRLGRFFWRGLYIPYRSLGARLTAARIRRDYHRT